MHLRSASFLLGLAAVACGAPLAMHSLSGVSAATRNGVQATSSPAATAQAATPGTDAAKLAFYHDSVKPILQTNCYRCHSGMNHRGGFSMATRTLLLKGGHEGTVVVPGNPEASLLVALIRHQGPKNDPMPMPPKSKLSDAEIATITRWIADGAVMDPQ